MPKRWDVETQAFLRRASAAANESFALAKRVAATSESVSRCSFWQFLSAQLRPRAGSGLKHTCFREPLPEAFAPESGASSCFLEVSSFFGGGSVFLPRPGARGGDGFVGTESVVLARSVADF